MKTRQRKYNFLALINNPHPIMSLTCPLTFLVLDLSFDIFDSVAGLDLKGDGLPRQRLYEDLHVCRLREKKRMLAPGLNSQLTASYLTVTTTLQF